MDESPRFCARLGKRASGGRPRSMTTSMRFFRSDWRWSPSRIWGGMTRKSNSRSSVISLLGKFTSPRRAAIWYPENMVLVLREDRDLDEILERSKTNPVLIFKHSTQCPISSHVYSDFKSFAESTPEFLSGVVLVVENRRLSNSIAERLKVRH